MAIFISIPQKKYFQLESETDLTAYCPIRGASWAASVTAGALRAAGGRKRGELLALLVSGLAEEHLGPPRSGRGTRSGGHAFLLLLVVVGGGGGGGEFSLHPGERVPPRPGGSRVAWEGCRACSGLLVEIRAENLALRAYLLI